MLLLCINKKKMKNEGNIFHEFKNNDNKNDDKSSLFQLYFCIFIFPSFVGELELPTTCQRGALFSFLSSCPKNALSSCLMIIIVM